LGGGLRGEGLGAAPPELGNGALGPRRAEDDVVLPRVDEDRVALEECLQHGHDPHHPVGEKVVLDRLIEDGVGHGAHMESVGDGGERP